MKEFKAARAAHERTQRAVAQQAELAREETKSFEQRRDFYQAKLKKDYGIGNMEAGLRKEARSREFNALFAALDWLDRPAQAFRSTAEEMIWGGRDDLAGAFLAGAQGKGPKSWADLLKKYGWADTDIGLPGPLKNVSVTDIVGMTLDLGTDMLAFKGLGAAARLGTVGKVPGAPFTPWTFGGKLRPEKLPGGLKFAEVPEKQGGLAGLARSTLGKQLPEETYRSIWKGEGIKPIALMTRDMLEGTPGVGKAVRGLSDVVGEFSVPFYSLIKAGRENSWLSATGEKVSLKAAAEKLPEMKRAHQVAGYETELALRNSPLRDLSPEEQETFLKFLLDEESMIPEASVKALWDQERKKFLAASSRESFVRKQAKARERGYLGRRGQEIKPERFTELRIEQLLKRAKPGTVDSDAMQKTLRWYLDEWEPVSRMMGKKLGLVSYLDLYLRRVFQRPGEGLDDLMGGIKRSKSDSKLLGFLHRRKPTDKPFDFREYLKEGGLRDPEMILRFDRQERRAGELFHEAIDELGMRWGYKIVAPKRPYLSSVRDPKTGQFAKKREIRAGDLGDTLGMLEQSDPPFVMIRSRGAQFSVLSKDNAAAWLNDRRPSENIFAVPAPLGAAMQKLMEPAHTKNFARIYDSAQALWKASVTSIFPAFHTRNMMGNLWNSYLLDGLDARDMTTAWGWRVNKTTEFKATVDAVDAQGKIMINSETGKAIQKTVTLDIDKDIIPLMMQNGAWNTGRYSLAEVRNAMLGGARPKQGPAVPMEKFADWVLDSGSPWLNWIKGGRTIGETIENTSKLAHVMTRMRKGDSLVDAIRGPNGANRAMFVYDLQTPSMQQFSRFFPFSRWFTQNVPYQFDRMLSKPTRFLGIQRVENLLTKRDFTDAEIALLPSWMLEQTSGIWSEDKEKGTLEILQASGLPAEDLNLLWTRDGMETGLNALSLASPFLRAVIEGPMDFSAFTGDKISNPAYSNYYRRWNPIFDRLPGPAADRIKSWLDYQEREIPDGRGGMKTVPYVGNTMGMYFLTSALGRGLSTAGRISRSADEEVEWAQTALNLLTGVKVSEKDLATPIGRASITTDRAYHLHGEDWDDVAAGFERWIDGVPHTDDEPTYTGEEYRTARSAILTNLFGELEANRQANLAQEYLINESDPNGLKRKRALLDYARKSFLGPELLAVEMYYSLDPSDKEFVGERGQPDMAEFYRARDEALERIRDMAGEATYQRVKKGHFLKKMPERVQRVEKRREEAMERLRPYRYMPSREGVDLETDERMKFVQRQISAYQTQYRGLPQATLKARRDYVQSTGDVRGLAEYRRWLSLPWSRERQAFVRKHATDFQEWMSDLYRWDQEEQLVSRAAGAGADA